MPLYKSLIFFILLLVSSSLILAFRYSHFLLLKCLLASYLTLFRLPTLLWFGFCNHYILVCFLWYKQFKHSPSNNYWCYFNSYRPRISLGEVLILSWMFIQTLFMSLSSLMFPKAANLFVNSIWYCFLTFRSFSYLKLNLSPSNFCTSCLLNANLSLTFATIRQWSVSM